ncbi:MAG: ribosome biogenesis GTP-binding protein YihA/YsxC [Cytophagales bacterium]
MTKVEDLKEVEFVKSSSDFSQCPDDGLPEFAFIGRSNVGKSSLINYLTNRKNLAKTSSTPGKTQLINHFKIDDELYFVDLPGYGYAKVSKGQKKVFQRLITDYLEGAKKLYCVFVLIDSRHKAQTIDLEFLEYLGIKQIPFAIVFTKVDKLSSNQAKKQIDNYKNELLKSWEYLPDIFISSATKQRGKNDILNFVKHYAS